MTYLFTESMLLNMGIFAIAVSLCYLVAKLFDKRRRKLTYSDVFNSLPEVHPMHGNKGELFVIKHLPSPTEVLDALASVQPIDPNIGVQLTEWMNSSIMRDQDKETENGKPASKDQGLS